MSSTLYDSGFYRGQSAGSLESARKIVPYVLSLLRVGSVCDLGCGVGTWLRAFREHGVRDIVGVDGAYVDRTQLQIPAAAFRPHDLSQPLTLDRQFDLACSLEVVEHLPESAADTMVANLTRLSPFILFSAAVPGQGGTGHINEQWPVYWQRRFGQARYELVDCFRARFWAEPDIDPWYAQNLFLYVRRDRHKDFIARRPGLAELPAFPLDAVHPAVFSLATHPDFWNILRLLALLPDEAMKLMKRRLSRG